VPVAIQAEERYFVLKSSEANQKENSDEREREKQIQQFVQVEDSQ